jgi:hypothetical protein
MASPNSVLYYLTLDKNTTLLNESSKQEKKTSSSIPDEEELQATQQTDKTSLGKTESNESLIHVWIICEPVATFDMQITSSRTIEDMMLDIEKRVWDLKQTRINVMRLQLSGDDIVMKGKAPLNTS